MNELMDTKNAKETSKNEKRVDKKLPFFLDLLSTSALFGSSCPVDDVCVKDSFVCVAVALRGSEK